MSSTKGPDVAFDFNRITLTLESIKNLKLQEVLYLCSKGTVNGSLLV